MYVVEVMPVARGAFSETLSFFSKTRLEAGMVIDAPIRNKKTAALVIASKEVRNEKATLRNSDFSLKKIDPKRARRIFSERTIEALTSVAEYHGTKSGVVISHFSPQAVIVSETAIHSPPAQEKPSLVLSDTTVLQAEYEERVSAYRNTTREAFAKGESVMVLAPTIPEAEKIYHELSRGIEEQAVLLTNALTKKNIIASWNRAVGDPEPILLVVTHAFITVPRMHLNTIFVERESARSYASHYPPHLDTRIAAEAIGKRNGIRIVFADFPVRVETHARMRSHDVEEFTRAQRTRRAGAPIRIIDTRPKETGAPKSKKKIFSSLSPQVETILTTEVERGARAFVYGARRGIAPLTVCNDCGTVVTDPATDAPMTLHKTEQGNVFLSFRSGATFPAHTSCRNCGSWNLVSLGIGALRIHEEIETLIPKTSLFLLTTETAPTHAQAKKIIKAFYTTPGAVLVGTDRALPYLYEPIEYTIVPSIDSALSSSAWRAHTHALQTLFFLSGNTTEQMYVQTRMPDVPPLRALASGNPNDFIDQELEDRKVFGYPPYATFIGLSWIGTENGARKNSHMIKEQFSDWDLIGPLPLRALAKNKYLGRAVIRLEDIPWPHPTLSADLKKLPPDITVTIDPDDIV